MENIYDIDVETASSIELGVELRFLNMQRRRKVRAFNASWQADPDVLKFKELQQRWAPLAQVEELEAQSSKLLREERGEMHAFVAGLADELHSRAILKTTTSTAFLVPWIDWLAPQPQIGPALTELMAPWLRELRTPGATPKGRMMENPSLEEAYPQLLAATNEAEEVAALHCALAGERARIDACDVAAAALALPLPAVEWQRVWAAEGKRRNKYLQLVGALAIALSSYQENRMQRARMVLQQALMQARRVRAAAEAREQAAASAGTWWSRALQLKEEELAAARLQGSGTEPAAAAEAEASPLPSALTCSSLSCSSSSSSSSYPSSAATAKAKQAAAPAPAAPAARGSLLKRLLRKAVRLVACGA